MSPARPAGAPEGALGRGMSRLGFRKSVDRLLAEATDKQGLAKTLSAWNLVTLGVAGIIGGGIFVLVGTGIVKAGALVVPAFVVAALICVVAGLAYAELAAAIPASGSAYAYIYTVMGELPGWLVAWALVLEYAVGAVSVAVACRNNILAVVNQFWHLAGNDPGRTVNLFSDPAQPALYGLTHSPLESGEAVNALGEKIVLHGWVNLPSIVMVLLVTMLLVRGTKESARFTAVLVTIKVAILLFAIGVAFTLFDPSKFAHLLPCYDTVTGTPCFAPGFPNNPATTYDATSFGSAVGAVMGAAAIMFFAYIGFDSVSTTAEETKDPKRDLPIGILGSLGISTLLYILAAGALVGAADWTEFVGPSVSAQNAVGEPFGYVFETHHSLDVMVNGAPFSLGALFVRLGAFVGTTSVLLVLILGGVRVFFNMSRDGLLPRWMSEVGPRGNPAKTTWVYGVFTLVLAGLLTLGAAVELVNIGTLFAFFMVILATWVFRRRRPDVERPFRMAALPVLVPLGLLGTLGLIVSLDPFTLVASVTWTGLGLLVYALYGVRHSREAAERVEALTPRPKVRPVTAALGEPDE